MEDCIGTLSRVAGLTLKSFAAFNEDAEKPHPDGDSERMTQSNSFPPGETSHRIFALPPLQTGFMPLLAEDI